MAQSFAQLTPDLWVTQSRSLLFNSGLVISEGQACLIDPGLYPGEIEGLARFVAERDAVPQTIILTHSHWDHVLGPERFPGIKTITHAGYLSEVDKHDAGIRHEIMKWEKRAGVRRERPFVIPRPDETFASEMTHTVGDLTLRLAHAPGHAPDQLVVYHADSAALWASDILSDREIPFVSDSLAAYERTLAQLSTWNVRALAPGHGQPTTDPVEIRARLSEDIAYLTELRERVEQAVWQGKTVEETVAICAGMDYRHRADNELPHRLNVESAYLELGGEADPRKYGYKQDWPEEA